MFFDGTEATEVLLLDGMGSLSNSEASGVSLEYCMDLAVFQLEELGVVKHKFLSDELVDGNLDYEISLTDRGRVLINNKQRFHFHDADE